MKIIHKGTTYELPEGSTYEDAAALVQNEYSERIVLARVDGYIRELQKVVEYDPCPLEFVTLGVRSGSEAYRRSVSFLAYKACYDVIGLEKMDQFFIDFSVNNGYYVRLAGDFVLDQALLDRIEARMREIVKADLPILKHCVPVRKARKIFLEQKLYDKERLLRYRRTSAVNLYSIDGLQDYFYGYLVPRTSYLTCFELTLHGDGFVLGMPTSATPNEVQPFKSNPKLFEKQITTSDWLNEMNLSTVGQLNDLICAGGFEDLMLVQEAIMEKYIGDIAEKIAADPEKKIVMIAGPSSSGKTTFSHRLSIQLRAHAKVPHPIAVDNYFKDREHTPKDENGNYDFECLEAVDVELFNDHMTRLLAGETVELPTFNFYTGKPEYKGNTLHLGENDVLVIEGIHCLNDRLSYALPKENKFKIYISALTEMNIDEHNRIATSDVRLLRRLVRDARTRGNYARDTLRMWPSVRRGEEKHIFPYQETADVIFNSAVVYELAILKQYAEPLLYDIEPKEPTFDEAQRLLKFLDYFQGVDSINVPINSLLREFIGGGGFKI
ncbi:MAG: nucleoside kinase [Lachnospiraceae bacterium]|nr:nucleoside kinase [Lachnospiraceae bacterium]